MTDFPFFGIFINEQIGLIPFFTLAGLATGLSPCLFPILPLTILSVFKAETSRLKALTLVTMVVAGMMTAFTVFTMIAASVSLFLFRNYVLLNQIFGSIIIFLGIILVVPRLQEAFTALTSRFSPDQPTETSGFLSLYFLGIVYTFIAIPCSGPVFFAVTSVLVTVNNFIASMLGLLIFGIALFIPYGVLALVSAEARMKITSRMVSKQHLLERLVGIFLIIYGFLLIISVTFT
ncbi:MAG: cytochrome c biogenesis CcdA family protein [Candidatus Odinarchaeota archaeon]